MAFSRWLCTSSTANLPVKIVHPGGHVELHYKPILAEKVMQQNPRRCLGYPHVFQQPWAIVEPHTVLMPGDKFYVVPLSTIKKLQSHYLRFFPCPEEEIADDPSEEVEEVTNGVSPCFNFVGAKNSPKPLDASMKNLNEDEDRVKGSDQGKLDLSSSNNGCLRPDNLFLCIKSKSISDDPTPTKENQSSILINKSAYTIRGTRRIMFSDRWIPNLESIVEE